MGSAYLKNMMGMRVSDEDLEDIPYPRLELGLHITSRFIQFGSVVGSLLAAPLVTAVAGPRTLVDLADRCLNYGLVGAKVGAAAGPVMTAALMRKEPDIAVYDRCYRLRYNRPQVRHDRFFLAGALLGAASDGAGGALAGVLGGIAACTLYNTLAGATAEAPRYAEIKQRVRAARQ